MFVFHHFQFINLTNDMQYPTATKSELFIYFRHFFFKVIRFPLLQKYLVLIWLMIDIYLTNFVQFLLRKKHIYTFGKDKLHENWSNQSKNKGRKQRREERGEKRWQFQAMYPTSDEKCEVAPWYHDNIMIPRIILEIWLLTLDTLIWRTKQ